MSIADEYGIAHGTIGYYIRIQPNVDEIRQQRNNNLIKLKQAQGQQSTTARMINKPLSKGNRAIRTTGPATGGKL